MEDREPSEVDNWHGSRGLLAAVVILAAVVVGLVLVGEAQGALG